MNSIIAEEAKELTGWNQQTETRSIYAVLEQLTDARSKRGQRYSLALILTFVLLAKAAGETTLQAIAEWTRLRGSWFQAMLPGIRPTFPCAATYSNVLRSILPSPMTIRISHAIASAVFSSFQRITLPSCTALHLEEKSDPVLSLLTL